MNYFITGTDTDCGKTFVTALLVQAARRAGWDAVAVKPFCCGPRDDVEILHAANDGVVPIESMNPVWLKTPAAPRACALLGELAADHESAMETMRDLATRHAHVLCEGAGGWLVPIARNFTIADFAAKLGWPVILVVRNKLGVLNHALLTAESIRARGLTLAGVILNNADGLVSPAQQTNRQILDESLGAPLMGEVPPGATSINWPSAII
jgi:dethiobiotin synthetase